ncbi:MAG: hypothetical protein M1812_004937 [Candelaria pacifica]|nr:MAG: hypothetical protein M1812_004937 [Candelaria pacifica]
MISPQIRRGKFTSLVLGVFITALLLTLFSGRGHRIQATGNRWRYGSSSAQNGTLNTLNPVGWSVPEVEAIVTAAKKAGSSVGSSSNVPFPEAVFPETVFTNADSKEVGTPESSTPKASTTSADAPEDIKSKDDGGEHYGGERKQGVEEVAKSTEVSLTGIEVIIYIEAIMTPEKSYLERLPCRASIGSRYNSLRTPLEGKHDGKIRYFFALDLYEVIHLLPTLVGSIVQTMRFLGPDSCALSIVEGRSKDGTPAVLEALRAEIEALGATYHYMKSDLNPLDGDRMGKLAALRNKALVPLTEDPKAYSNDANIIFLNDVGICPHDILELLYQHSTQHAHMTCGMDWVGTGDSFYDIYIARSLVGETFFQIAQDGLWTFAKNLFWADRAARRKFEGHHPFQVYACWNGGAIISAAPVIRQRIAFRSSIEGECFMGEPTLFCKDLWRLKMGRIQVVPTVNVGYAQQLNATQIIKDQHGWVEDHVDVENEEPQVEMIEWQEDPPSLVKCMVFFHEPYWVPST